MSESFNKSARLVVVCLVALALPSLALASGDAAGEHHDALPLKQMGFHALNLAILVGFFAWLARGKVGPALKARADQVAHAIRGASAAEAEAKARAAELEGRLKGLDQEIARLKAEAEVGAQKEHEGILAQAHRDAEQLAQNAARTIRDEAERARASLRAEAGKLAVELATQQVTVQISEADQDRLGGDFLSTVRNTSEVRHG